VKSRFKFWLTLLIGVIGGVIFGCYATERDLAADCLSKRHAVIYGVHFSCQLGPAKRQ